MNTSEENGSWSRVDATRKATPNYIKITTHDTTLEALLTGKARLATWRDYPRVDVLDLQDPFQNTAPCFQDAHPLRKTDTVWHLMVNYGQGWEHELTEDSWREMRDRLREYRENCPQYPVKAVRKHELKPQYSEVTK